MSNLYHNIDRFFYKNHRKGIPNLMLYIMIATGIVYLITMVTGNDLLYTMLCFDRASILRGQVWRLFSYVFISFHPAYDHFLVVLIAGFCYFSLGRAIESTWGTLRFNLFYLSGVVLLDIFGMIFGVRADPSYLNLSLLLVFASLYPDARFLLLFFIPIRAWILALVNIGLVLLAVFTSGFPGNLLPLVTLVNFVLFLGPTIVNILPPSLRAKIANRPRNVRKETPKTIPFPEDGKQKSQEKVPYTHRCTVCGRTDISHPDLEFRYCSRCNGYFCYCEDHINNHEHVQ